MMTRKRTNNLKDANYVGHIKLFIIFACIQIWFQLKSINLYLHHADEDSSRHSQPASQPTLDIIIIIIIIYSLISVTSSSA